MDACKEKLCPIADIVREEISSIPGFLMSHLIKQLKTGHRNVLSEASHSRNPPHRLCLGPPSAQLPEHWGLTQMWAVASDDACRGDSCSSLLLFPHGGLPWCDTTVPPSLPSSSSPLKVHLARETGHAPPGLCSIQLAACREFMLCSGQGLSLVAQAPPLWQCLWGT